MYIVMTSSAKMPSTCRGRYRNVAVVQTDGTTVPKMISRRAKGVVDILGFWEKLNVGKTEACAYRRALVEANAVVNRLNANA